jgi:formate-dependent phosphoribosylglycinamide formyltransferase (GAR transformylase)
MHDAQTPLPAWAIIRRMGTAHPEKRRYLLLFGATMALRERAIVAAIRVFDGPIATISRTANTRAAKFFDHVLIGDFSDPDASLQAVLDFERETGMTPAGVVPFIDACLMSGWAIADHYGIPYLSRDAVEDSSINKNRMKDRLQDAGIATPRYIQVDGPDAVRKAIAEFGLPCIIKPSAFGGSLGVRLISDEAEVPDAYAYVKQIIEESTATFTVKNHAIQVEEFCTLADEVSVEVLNHGDQRTVLAVVDKSLGPRPYFAEIGHRVPSVYSGRQDVRDLAVRACAAIGLDRGLAHVELRLERDQPPQIMEVGARTAGDGILDQVERVFGMAPCELHVRSYLDRLDGELAQAEPSGLAAIAVLKAPPGQIAEVRTVGQVDTAVCSYEVFAAPGTVSSATQANYLNREGYVECFWPGASAESIPPQEHVDISGRLAAQIFRMAGAPEEDASPA